MTSFNKLCRQTFACDQDAEKALERWLKEQDYIQVSDKNIIESVIHQGRGRPKQDAQDEKIYQVSGQLATNIRKKETKEEVKEKNETTKCDLDKKLTENKTEELKNEENKTEETMKLEKENEKEAESKNKQISNMKN
jgi:hypothetical protein